MAKAPKENKAVAAAPENKAEEQEAVSHVDTSHHHPKAVDPNKRYKVKMLGSKLGCDAGVIYPTMYKEGEEYEIGESLYNTFKSEGLVK